jgi:hypothetical protein
MNHRPENKPEEIRSDINNTRQRMDNTLDALGERLQGRHLLDEIVGFFRRDADSNNRGAQLRQKISHSAGSAAHAVADTVKSNPMPALLIGAGVVWMVYASQRRRSGHVEYDYAPENDYGAAGRQTLYDPDAGYDEPLDYPSGDATPVSERSFDPTEETGFAAGSGIENAPAGVLGNLGSKLEHTKEKIAGAAGPVREKISAAGQRVREKAHLAGERARDASRRAKERAQHAYEVTREKIVTTADQHPLEVGLGCLAVGVAVGLALPTPERVNRLAGPSMERLRQRTRDAGHDVLEKGKRVVNAAGTALKSEAEAQGLSLERLRQKAGAVVDRTKSAATETAREQGVIPSGVGMSSSQNRGEPQSAQSVGMGGTADSI